MIINSHAFFILQDLNLTPQLATKSIIMFAYLKNKFDSLMRKTRSTGNLNLKSKGKETNNEPDLTEKYELINKTYSKHLNCPACKTLMKNPQRIHPCGHTFCSLCVPLKGKCLTCEKKVTVVQKDLVGEGLINQMQVRCLNQGCPYKGTFEEYKKYHQKQCKLDKGLEEWIKSMQGTLDQHNQPVKLRRSSSDYEERKERSQEKTEIKIDFLAKKEKQEDNFCDFQAQLFEKKLRTQL